MDYNQTIPTWTELFQIKYEKDDIDTTVVDAAIVEDDLSIIIVLEKTQIPTQSSSIIKAYQIDLSNINITEYDISHCFSLNKTSCDDKLTINKRFISSFEDDSHFAGTIPNANAINWDGLAVGHGLPCYINEDKDDDGYFLLAVSDSGDNNPTYFAYICFIYNGTTTTMPPFTSDYILTPREERLLIYKPQLNDLELQFRSAAVAFGASMFGLLFFGTIDAKCIRQNDYYPIWPHHPTTFQ